jgi:hypothetical protein
MQVTCRWLADASQLLVSLDTNKQLGEESPDRRKPDTGLNGEGKFHM